MFEQLFKRPSVIDRHRNAPYANERASYLTFCAQHGYTNGTLLMNTRELLWVARKLSGYSDLHLTSEQVRAVACRWKERELSCGRVLNKRWTRIRFCQTAMPWLRFLGCLQENRDIIPFDYTLDDYSQWAEHERGLPSTTIKSQKGYIAQFLRWYGTLQKEFSEVRPTDIDDFFAERKSSGCQRISIANYASALRTFFKHASTKGWCDCKMWSVIRGPRLFVQETLPSGPSWQEVAAILASVDTDDPLDIRDRAILLLFALYGLRASEVSRLKLEDINWELDRLCILRSKHRGRQAYPLLPIVGNAVARYLKKYRPSSEHREVFLTVIPPFRPLSRGALYYVTRKRLDTLGIRAAHLGPHSLRHACATHLAMDGFSLKEIGDHLGHRSSSATRIYAKVDLSALREVADFDLGGLI